MSTDLKPGTRVQAILLDRNDDALVDLPGMQGAIVSASEWPVAMPEEWTEENTVLVRWDDPERLRFTPYRPDVAARVLRVLDNPKPGDTIVTVRDAQTLLGYTVPKGTRGTVKKSGPPIVGPYSVYARFEGDRPGDGRQVRPGDVAVVPDAPDTEITLQLNDATMVRHTTDPDLPDLYDAGWVKVFATTPAPQDHGPLAATLSERTLAKVLSRPAHVPSVVLLDMREAADALANAADAMVKAEEDAKRLHNRAPARVALDRLRMATDGYRKAVQS